MTGPLALIGGGEHVAGCEPIECRLLDLTGVARPQVAVIPTASAPRQLPKTAALARNYWSRLGTSVRIALPECDMSYAEDAIALADVIVLPGGHPNKLVASLGASRLTDLIVDRWMHGVAISGSSAGAMCLFEWRIKLYPAKPLRTIPGLGLLDGFVAAPHFDRFTAARWAYRALPSLGGLGVVGLDESTALVGGPEDYVVVGDGHVTVVDASETVSYRAGNRVPIDLMAGSSHRMEMHSVNGKESNVLRAMNVAPKHSLHVGAWPNGGAARLEGLEPSTF